MLGSAFYPVTIPPTLYYPFASTVDSNTAFQTPEFQIGSKLPVITTPPIFDTSRLPTIPILSKRQETQTEKPVISDDSSFSLLPNIELGIPDWIKEYLNKFFYNSAFSLLAFVLILIGGLLLFGETVYDNKEKIASVATKLV